MRRIVDFSDYQSGLNLDVVAQAVDGAWAKAGDWSWIAAYGWPGDYVHTQAINRFLQLDKPVGTYLFVRPGWTSPATQIDGWRRNTPDGTTLRPMIDLEVPGVLSGQSLTDWVAEALALTADRFEATPVLYWSRAFQQAYGMGIPQTPHYPMVAEYHRGYTPFLWSGLSGWENYAYSAYGGPDVPNGYEQLTSLDMIWQFTSSAQIPGFNGLVDCSFCNETVFALITAPDPVIIPDPDEQFWSDLMADPRVQHLLDDAATTRSLITDIHATLGSPGSPDSPGRISDYITDTRAGVEQALKLVEATYWATGNQQPAEGVETVSSDARATRELAAGIADTVAKLSAGNVDVDQLARRIIDAITQQGGVKLDAAAIAQTVRAEFGTALLATPSPPTSLSARLEDLPVADPDPNRRAATVVATLADDLFNPRHGLAARVGMETAKLRPAPGEEITDADRAAALTRALADTAARAGFHAAVTDATAPTSTEPTTASSDLVS